MITKIFTVYDSKAAAYLPPFFAPATGLAIRSFSEAVNKSDHDFNKYAGDYTLFEIGIYDDDTAKIDQLPVHLNLGVGTTFITS